MRISTTHLNFDLYLTWQVGVLIKSLIQLLNHLLYTMNCVFIITVVIIITATLERIP